MLLRFLGSPELVADFGVVHIGGPRQRVVLSMLALNANRVVSVELLIDAIWDSSPPPTARGQIQVAISALRKALAGTCLTIRTQPPGYVLDVPDGELDIEVFLSLVGAARRHAASGRHDAAVTDLLGPFFGAKYAIPHLRRAGGGAIINTGSANSLQAEKSLVGYSASKGGVLMLTRALALDHAGEGIRVNCICPGFVDTPINLPHYERLGGIDAVRASLAEWVPARRGGEPAEIAGVAAWLASDLSTYVTGAAVPADGGLTAQL